MTAPALAMRGIGKRYPGVQALKNVSLEAFAGEALALVGANGAGKSTLMNVLGGVAEADEGQILIRGEPVRIASPGDAARHGIAFVHQEIAVLPTMTVAENMAIDRFPQRGGLIDRRAMRARCAPVLERLGCSFGPDVTVERLSIGDRQMVEIGRALLAEPSIVIFDEPTSSLTSREKERLFAVLASLKQAGVTVIYITHFLDEIFRVCERAVVLRGGETVGGGPLSDLTPERLVELMIGRSGGTPGRARRSAVGEPILRVTGLTRGTEIEDVSFTLHRGEILGLWGLLGSGRTEIVRALVGLDEVDGGQVELRRDGTWRTVRPREASRQIGFVTEDRRSEGLLLPMSIRDNMALANLRGLARFGLVDRRRAAAEAGRLADRLRLVHASLRQPVRTLSGGNQQKVVVGRWLQVAPPIWILDEPTRGLDVGAKAEICAICDELAAAGAAVIVISSEIEEMTALCDRFLVIHRGRIVRELPAGTGQPELMAAAAGAA